MSYKPELSRNWWLKHHYYSRYMLREATVLPLLFFCGCLLGALFSLTQGEACWQQWLMFMRHPLVVALNLLALIASLYHAKTFFELFPRVMPIRIAGKTLPASLMIAAQWAGTVFTALLLLVIIGGMI
ncbi:fumarate reductase subunit C [Chromatiaceae bacterium AAb-1]|nr:fumarate reductase subunit C [Chromatiaceae bacterium AAb-1]